MKLGAPKGIERYALLNKFDQTDADERTEEPQMSTWLQMRKIRPSFERARKRITNEQNSRTSS
jgi:hypothetical protein